MRFATDGPEPTEPRRVPAPWGDAAAPADKAIALLLGLYLAYSLALWPLVPALIGSHPLLLEILSGSTLAEVTVGARSRLGELPMWFAVAAGLPATMVFDWVFWWAGRRWGDRALHLLLGSGSSPRALARRDARAVRLERLADRYGPAGVVLAYYLPLPTVLIYAAAGLSGCACAPSWHWTCSARCSGSALLSGWATPSASPLWMSSTGSTTTPPC